MATRPVRIVVTATDKASGVLRGISSAIGGIGTVAAGILTAGAFQGIARQIGETTRALADMTTEAARLANAEAAFEGFTARIGESASATLDVLQDSSGGMIANRDLMLSYNRAAQLVSADFAQTLPDALQYLGRVSAATGEDMGFLMDSLVRGVGRLSPLILDNLGIQVSLTEAYDAYADSIGVATDSLTRQQQQMAVANAVMEALRENVGDLPDITDTAAGRLAAFQATIQNTRDEIGTAFIPVMDTLLTTFSDLTERFLPPLVDFIESELAPAFERLASVFAALSSGDVMGFVGALGEIAPALGDFVQNILGLGEVEGLSGVISGLGIEDAQEAMQELTRLPPVSEILQNIIGTLPPEFQEPFQGLLDAFGNLGAAIQERMPDIQDAFANMGQFLSDAISLVGPQIIENITGIVNSIAEIWREHGDEILSVVTIAWELLVATVGGAITLISGLVTAALAVIQGDWSGAWQAISDSFVAFFDLALSIVGSNFAEFTAMWQANWEALVTIVTMVWDIIRTAITNAWQSVVDTVTGVWNSITGAFTSAGDTISQTTTNTWQSIRDGISNVLSTIGDAITNAWQSIVTAVTTAVNNVRDAIVGVFQTIATALDPYITPIVKLVTDAWNAIIEITQIVLGTLGEIMSLIFGAIVELLSILFQAIQMRVTEAWNNILAVVVPILETIRDAIVTAWTAIVEFITPILQTIATVITTAWIAVSTAVTTAMQAVSDFLINAWNTIAMAITGVWETISAAITTAWETISGIVTTGLLILLEQWQLAWDTVTTILQTAWETIVAAVTTAFETVRLAVQTGIQNALDAIRGFISNFSTVGRDLIAGLVSGIRAAASQVVSALSSIIDNAISAARSRLGISSPSKIFEQIGIDTMRGFAEGVAQMARIPEMSINAAMGGAIGGAQMAPALVGAGAGAGGMGGGGMVVVNLNAPILTLLDEDAVTEAITGPVLDIIDRNGDYLS